MIPPPETIPMLSTGARLAAGLAMASVLAAGCGGGGADDIDAGAQTDAAATPDARVFPPDAAVVDCSGDHQESAENFNDALLDQASAAEHSSLLLTAGGNLTICGQIDPAEADDQYTDSDVFEFNLEDEIAVRFELTAPGAADLAGLELGLYDASGPIYLGASQFVGNFAVLTADLQPGSYWISVLSPTPAPEAPVGYLIRMRERATECPAAGGAPDFTEGGDGGDSRGNDAVSVDYSAEPPFATASGTPETSGLSLAPASSAHLRGTSAAVDPLDSYRDRDAFVIATGAGTNEIELRLSWDHAEGVDADLDLYLFAQGDPTTDHSWGAGTAIGTAEDELFTIAVEPETSYWLWVGGHVDSVTLPQVYDITACGRSFAP